jgi:hypothetical protein
MILSKCKTGSEEARAQILPLLAEGNRQKGKRSHCGAKCLSFGVRNVVCRCAQDSDCPTGALISPP